MEFIPLLFMASAFYDLRKISLTWHHGGFFPVLPCKIFIVLTLIPLDLVNNEKSLSLFCLHGYALAAIFTKHSVLLLLLCWADCHKSSVQSFASLLIFFFGLVNFINYWKYLKIYFANFLLVALSKTLIPVILLVSQTFHYYERFISNNAFHLEAKI